MDPKVLLLLPGFVAPQQQHSSATPTVRVWAAPVMPRYEWPERREPIEGGEHPGHGEGSDESPMFVGTTTNTNVASDIMVDSGASAGPYLHNGWLSRGLNIITSSDEFVLQEQISPSPFLPPSTVLDSPDTTRYRSNPSMIKIRRTFIKQPR